MPELIVKAWPAKPLAPHLGARLHHDHQPFSISDDNKVTSGYRLLALEVGSRHIGGLLLGAIAWRTH